MPAPFDTRPLRALMHRRLAPRTILVVSLGWFVTAIALVAAAIVSGRFWVNFVAAFWLPGCLVAAGALYDLAVKKTNPRARR